MTLRSITQNAFAAIIEAEAKRMEQLFRAWDQEIERSFEALREEQKKLNQSKLAEYTAAQREYHQDQAGDIAASVLLQRLGHAEVFAEATGKAVSVPEGLKVASAHQLGPSLSELSSVAAELQEELHKSGAKDPGAGAQASLAFALQAGLLPHPGELGRLLDALGIAPEKAKELVTLGQRLDRIEQQSFAHPRLQYEGATQKLEVLKKTKDELSAIGGEGLLRLALRPESMRGQPLPYQAPSGAASGSGMSKQAFDQMLTSLFAKK